MAVAMCTKCGQPENLAEPLIDGVCGDCLRKAAGPVQPQSPSPAPVATIAILAVVSVAIVGAIAIAILSGQPKET